jgi:glutathione S-transferase
MKLYLTESSGNSYKVRVLASILKVRYQKVIVDWDAKEHKQPAFLRMNPRGQVPVMVIEGKALWDSTAHLVYLARQYGGKKWLPTDALGLAEVSQWLAFAQNEVYFGLQWSRGVVKGLRGGNLEEYQAYARKALDALTWRLEQHDWLALNRPTIADIACYPYVKRAPEGGLSLVAYPAVKVWLKRCEEIPGWLKLD